MCNNKIVKLKRINLNSTNCCIFLAILTITVLRININNYNYFHVKQKYTITELMHLHNNTHIILEQKQNVLFTF